MNEFAGRNDHIHGDENTAAQTSNDVIEIIANNYPTAREWVKHLQQTDLFHHFIIIIAKNRANPEFSELINEFQAQIEEILC